MFRKMEEKVAAQLIPPNHIIFGLPMMMVVSSIVIQ